jgi:hypothetical protein
MHKKQELHKFNYLDQRYMLDFYWVQMDVVGYYYQVVDDMTIEI